MWIASPRRGFYSVVERDGHLVVRARAQKDLQNLDDLIPDRQLLYSGRKDYPWRFECTHDEWAHALVILAHEIVYPNFKNEVHNYNPHRAHVYGQVWGDLIAIKTEDEPPVLESVKQG